MSPRSFTSDERALIDRSLRDTAARLMRTMRLRDITVDDIVRGAGIAKGTFYSFHRSREELLWAAVKDEERALVERIAVAATGEGEFTDRVRHVFADLLLDGDSLVFRLSPEDIAVLTRKLPAELLTEDSATGREVLLGLLSAFELPQDRHTVNLLQGMVHTLGFVAANEREGAAEAAPELLALLTDAFTARLAGLREQ